MSDPGTDRGVPGPGIEAPMFVDHLDGGLDAAVRELAAQRTVLVALDFDGVLAPLVDDPATSRILPLTVEALERLAVLDGVVLALVSGRDATTLAQLAEVPADRYTVPLGQAAIRREGRQMTVLAYGTMVHVALAAAQETGIDAEVSDLRSLLPLDLDCIAASVRRTGRCLIVHEATLTSGFGAELAALVQAECFWHLQAPIGRVTGWDTPYPHVHEWHYFPGPARVGAAMREVMEEV